jgi:hypothetical protein
LWCTVFCSFSYPSIAFSFLISKNYIKSKTFLRSSLLTNAASCAPAKKHSARNNMPFSVFTVKKSSNFTEQQFVLVLFVCEWQAGKRHVCSGAALAACLHVACMCMCMCMCACACACKKIVPRCTRICFSHGTSIAHPLPLAARETILLYIAINNNGPGREVLQV